MIAWWLAAGGLCLGQTSSQSALENKLDRADKLQNKGSLAEARALYLSVLAALPSKEISTQLGHTLNGLSNVSSSLGDYPQAIEYAQRADDVYRQLGNVEGEAYAFNNRAIAEGELGQYLAAQASLRQALDFSQRAGDFETQVRTLNNLGNAYYFPGEYLEALRSYQKALQLLDSHSTEKWAAYWRQITHINEATLYQRLGRYQTALQTYKQIDTSSKALNDSDRAQLLTNLGVLYRRLGDSWKALDSYRATLDLFSRQHDAGGQISVLKNIGIVYALDQSDLGKAQTFFERALSLAKQAHNQREETQAHLYLGETHFRKGDLSAALTEFQKALTQARSLGLVEEQWKALYGMGRVKELSCAPAEAESHYREAVSIIETTRTQLQLSALRAEFLADKRDAYDALIAILIRKNDAKDAFSFLERSRARTFQDRLAATSSRKTNTPVALSLDEARSYLDPSTILMEFWVSGNRLALIWCTRESYGLEQTQFSVFEREEVLSFLRRLPGNLDSNWRQQTTVLGRLIPPGWSLPPSVRRALIVPDGWLSSVPFDLVPAPGNAGAMLIERLDISYLPTAAILRRAPVEERAPRLPWTNELAGFGNPMVRPLPGGSRDFEASGLQSLPYSGEEILSIARITRGKDALFLGAHDVKSAFLTAPGQDTPILHVSTHAFADADIPENSRILFSSQTSEGAADYVFVRELYDMDLRTVNLATLSACDTERGRMIRGEGVQAFSRALLFAGSRTAVTTLWRVADQPTSEFMKQFYYFALEKRQPKAEALRSAKLKFLRSNTELANPAHWAGFVLTGDGIGVLPRFVSWGVLIFCCAIATMLFAILVWYWLKIRQRIHGIDRP